MQFKGLLLYNLERATDVEKDSSSKRAIGDYKNTPIPVEQKCTCSIESANQLGCIGFLNVEDE